MIKLHSFIQSFRRQYRWPRLTLHRCLPQFLRHFPQSFHHYKSTFAVDIDNYLSTWRLTLTCLVGTRIIFFGFPNQALRHLLASIVSGKSRYWRSIINSFALLKTHSHSALVQGIASISKAKRVKSGCDKAR